MLRNVFSKTLRDARVLILSWGIGLALIAVVLVYIFSTLREDVSLRSLDSMVLKLSPVIKAFVGGGQPIPSLTTFEGFMQLEFYQRLPLLLAICAIVEGSAAVAMEQERRTIELLMVQPIQRWRMIAEKFFAMVVGLYLIAALAGLGIVAATRIISVDAPWHRMLLASVNAVPPALVVGALSLWSSCMFRRRRTAVTVGTVFLIVSYLLSVLGQIAPILKPWVGLSIFHTYDISRPLTGDLVPRHTGTLLVATLILVLFAVFSFRRKELAT